MIAGVGRDGRAIVVGSTVRTLGEKIGRVVSIDVDGYARLEGRVSTFYVPHLELVVAEVWIASNRVDGSPWHLARVEDVRAKSGKLFGVVRRAACNGRTLGSAFGYSMHDVDPTGGSRPSGLCERCRRIADAEKQ